MTSGGETSMALANSVVRNSDGESFCPSSQCQVPESVTISQMGRSSRFGERSQAGREVDTRKGSVQKETKEQKREKCEARISGLLAYRRSYALTFAIISQMLSLHKRAKPPVEPVHRRLKWR